MLDNRREALQAVNSLFGTSIEVELNSSWDYRVFEGASIHNTEEEVASPVDAPEDAPADAPVDATVDADEDALVDTEEDAPVDAEEDNNG